MKCAVTSHSRHALLAASLDIPVGALNVTRANVEAALWQTVGWHAEDSIITRLMAVIDGYADSRSRSAVASWVQAGRGGEVPPAPSLAQLHAVRQQLRSIVTAVPPPRDHVTPAPRRHHLTAVPDPAPAAVITRSTATITSAVQQRPLAPPLPVGDALMRSPEPLYECTGQCHRDLPRSAFHNDNSRKSGIATRCKECKKKDNAKYRKAAANRRLASEAAESLAGDSR